MRDAARVVRRQVIASSGDCLNRGGLVTLQPPLTRFSLRIGADEATRRGTVAGLRLDLPINRCSVDGERIAARLGPDEWLLLAPEPDGIGLGENISAELEGSFFALTDVGHRNVGFQVAGIHAAEIINGGCPLDLLDTAFPARSATRTLLGKAEIVLIRPGVETAYRVECWRSFASYVAGLLNEVAREFDSVQ
jgi:sarcosine oxidase subunit gamma